MNTSRVFAYAGLDVWREPLRDIGRPLTEEERAALPDDLHPAAKNARAIEGWPEDKPFVSSWAHNPRFHPPGELLVTAPVAAAYHFTSLPFAAANRLTIALFLVFAHLSLYVFGRALMQMEAGAIGFLGAFVVYGETIHLTLEGFYEAIIIGPLILSARALARRDGLAGTGWFSLAVFVHFRALFFLPLLAYGLYLIWSQRAWTRWGRRSWAFAGASGLALAMTLGVISLLWSQLNDITVNNRVYGGTIWYQPAIVYAAVAVLLTVVLVRAEAWMDLALLAWLFAAFMQLREAYPWDVLTLLAWIGFPIVAQRPAWARDVRLVALLFAARFVFGNESFPVPMWLLDVV